MALNYTASAAIAITSAATLANGSAASSAAVTTNTTNNTVDAMVTVECGVGTVAAPNQILIYAYGSEDGVDYAGNSATSDDVNGTDKAITLNANGTNMRFLGSIRTLASGVTARSQPFSVAAAFGGVLPRKWGIVAHNQSGAALTACSASYTEIYYS